MPRFAVPLLLVVALLGCDSTSDPSPSSLAGTYALVAVDGQPLPSGGVTSGQLRLRIDNTIPVYDAEWVTSGGRDARRGLFSLTGSVIEFSETSGAGSPGYTGQIDGDRIRVTFAAAPFTFERSP